MNWKKTQLERDALPCASSLVSENTRSIPFNVRNNSKKILLPLFNIIYEVLATAIREEKELKYLKIKKKRQKCSLFYD